MLNIPVLHRPVIVGAVTGEGARGASDGSDGENAGQKQLPAARVSADAGGPGAIAAKTAPGSFQERLPHYVTVPNADAPAARVSTPAGTTASSIGPGGEELPTAGPAWPADAASRWGRLLSRDPRRPRDGIEDIEVRAAPRVCPTLIEQASSDPLEVRRMVTSFCAALQALGLDPADSATLEIVLVEALNNIVEHAYGDELSGWILLEVDFLRGWVVCRLTDGGGAMPDHALPPCQGPRGSLAMDAPVDNLPEGGFGWGLIFALTSHLRYRRDGAINTLSFALPLTSTL